MNPDEFLYYKDHVILAQAGAGTHYPVGIRIYRGPGSDGAEAIRGTTFGAVYVNTYCQADFDDIRFTKDDGVTDLAHWREEVSSGTYASFWVQIEDSLSSNPTTIRIYYGNSTVSTASSPLDVDIISVREYDVYASWDPNYYFAKATVPEAIEMNGYIETTKLGDCVAFVHAPLSYINGKRVQVKWSLYQNEGSYRSFGFVSVVDHAHRRWYTTEEFLDNDNTRHFQVDYNNRWLGTFGMSGIGWTSPTDYTTATLPLTANTFTSEFVTLCFFVNDAWSQTTHGLRVGTINILDAGGSTLKTYDMTSGTMVTESSGSTRDYGLYRKKWSPEPTHGTWGVQHSVSYDWEKGLTEIFGMNDAFSYYRTSLFNESLNVTDDFLTLLLRQIICSEDLLLSPFYEVDDLWINISLQEADWRTPNKVNFETLEVYDEFARTFSAIRVLAETLSILPVRTVWFERLLTEMISIVHDRLFKDIVNRYIYLTAYKTIQTYFPQVIKRKYETYLEEEGDW